MTPLAAIVGGLLAGAVGTVALDTVQYVKYRRGGGKDSPLAWEFAPVDSWEKAPAPGQVGKRVIEGFTQRELPDRSAWLVSTIMHWGYGSANGAAYGVLAGSLRRPRASYGLPFGAVVWITGYIVLPEGGLYQPIWKYDAKTLAIDLSAHLAYGATTGAAFRLLARLNGHQMATELILLGTAGAPNPVAGRGGISSALIVGERVFVIDCGRGSPSAFAAAGLDFTRLEAVFLTHLHADHVGDLPGMLLYPWGVRAGENGPLPPIRVYGPSPPESPPAGDGCFPPPDDDPPGTAVPRGVGPGRLHPGRVRLPSERHAARRPHAGPGRSRPRHRRPRPGQERRRPPGSGDRCRRRSCPGHRRRRDARPRGSGAGVPFRHRGRLRRVLR